MNSLIAERLDVYCRLRTLAVSRGASDCSCGFAMTNRGKVAKTAALPRASRRRILNSYRTQTLP